MIGILLSQHSAAAESITAEILPQRIVSSVAYSGPRREFLGILVASAVHLGDLEDDLGIHLVGAKGGRGVR